MKRRFSLISLVVIIFLIPLRVFGDVEDDIEGYGDILLRADIDTLDLERFCEVDYQGARNTLKPEIYNLILIRPWQLGDSSVRFFSCTNIDGDNNYARTSTGVCIQDDIIVSIQVNFGYWYEDDDEEDYAQLKQSVIDEILSKYSENMIVEPIPETTTYENAENILMLMDEESDVLLVFQQPTRGIIVQYFTWEFFSAFYLDKNANEVYEDSLSAL